MCARRAIIRRTTPVAARWASGGRSLLRRMSHRVHPEILDAMALISEAAKRRPSPAR
jgi:hypothetical protein